MLTSIFGMESTWFNLGFYKMHAKYGPTTASKWGQLETEISRHDSKTGSQLAPNPHWYLFLVLPIAVCFWISWDHFLSPYLTSFLDEILIPVKSSFQWGVSSRNDYPKGRPKWDQNWGPKMAPKSRNLPRWGVSKTRTNADSAPFCRHRFTVVSWFFCL